MNKIPFNDLSRQMEKHGKNISGKIENVLSSGWFLNGRETLKFEEEFADFNGLTDIAACSSGTDALEIILRAWGIGAGDEVLVPANTWVSDAEVVVRIGATPVFVDVNISDGTMDIGDIRTKKTNATKAIIVVHLYGCIIEIGPIRSVLGPSVKILEDYAHAVGLPVANRRNDVYGDAFAFSFYPTKNLGALGDAGAIGSHDADLVRQARLLRDHGQVRRDHHVLTGATNRMDEIQAAVLRYKLTQLSGWILRRQHIARAYQEVLSGHTSLSSGADYSCAGACHLFIVLSGERKRFLEFMDKRSIGYGIHYPSALPDMAPYRAIARVCPNAARRAENIVSLPLFPELNDDEVSRVCDAVRHFE